jgi:hypothetical protein
MERGGNVASSIHIKRDIIHIEVDDADEHRD